VASENLHFRSICYQGLHKGPNLLVLGAVHGNEICGSLAINRLIGELDAGKLTLDAGQLTLIPITNPLAYQKQQRMGDRNLNRNLSPTDSPLDFEDRIANWLCPILARHEVLLDLHSFHTGGQAFAMLGPLDNQGKLEPFAQARQEEAMALRLGVSRFVDGWLDTYAAGVARRVARLGKDSTRVNQLNTDPRYGVGTTEYMRSQGGLAITLECGQHADPQSPLVAYRAILNTLAHFRLIQASEVAPATETEALSLYEVVDKDHASDAFAKPWASFDALRTGDLIGTRHDGQTLVAQQDGYIVFPNPKAEAGQEWFYLARASNRI
jgi:predicted deacylase